MTQVSGSDTMFFVIRVVWMVLVMKVMKAVTVMVTVFLVVPAVLLEPKHVVGMRWPAALPVHTRH